jgi:hypothetical protein
LDARASYNTVMPPTKNNTWKWFFAILFALALFASILMIAVSWHLQLKPELLEAARERWETSGPANYIMVYTTRRNDETTTDHYVVKVRKKKTYEVIVNDLPLTERLDYYGMDAMFNDIERFQDMDNEKGKPRTYTRATFDDHTGAIRWYVRRVMGSRERQEINVEPLETK